VSKRRRIVVGGEPPKKKPIVEKPVVEPAPEQPVAVPHVPPSTEERGQIAILVDEIRKDPFSDAPRQVLADALEQRGDARAQLIQLQIRRASLPAWDPQVVTLELQERVLLAEHAKRWRAKLPELAGVTWGPYVRGFVEKVAFRTFDAFVEHGAACFAASPVTGIAIPWPRSGKQHELDAVPHLRELTVVGTAMRKQDLEWLASSPLFATVRTLTLLDSQLQSLAGLLKSPHLAGLEALCLPLHVLDDGSIYKLAQTALPNLTTLELATGTPEQEYGSGSGRRSPRRTLSTYAAKALASWRGLAKVRTLDISAAKFGVEGLTALTNSPYSAGLTALTARSIADSKWDVDDSLTAFGSGPAGALDELDVSDNDLDADGAAQMASCRALQALKVLRIERVESKHFERLAKAAWFDSLRILACGEAALLPIVKRAPKQLHTLRVVPDGATPRDLVRRLLAGPLPSVTALDLSDAKIGDDGLRLLGTADTLPNLVALQLAGAGKPRFTRAAAEEFARSPLARQLQSLELGFAELDRLPATPRIPIGQGEYKGARRYL
jgi:uncharacterized protein (TIGR02996 family)